MAFTYGTPALWLSHARDARQLADTIGDTLIRRAALKVADDYEKKGERAGTTNSIAQGDAD